MNSNVNPIGGYAFPLLVVVLFGVYYFNGVESIVKPTAHQSLSNATFMRFVGYSSVILAIVLISMYTKTASFFFWSLTAASLLWFILGKSWQYTPV
jgi:hypothetical protein